ncbi:D-alanine--D-alanine ligase family protein [Protaetiibacter mangrovi]|uniref:D-alanine--D-alanine ligase n=1 Tax=Protaetiibacter mangrovi TaxID=2970926 RepID=A0ABT1ZI37_9MICO|nr:D-alanine--D-alanine ligase family protein [Protaetiibacter mangrovi]MCS0500361.1 D-alanine--D-alanine ligase [Protaetiibacter mangrovi]TPX05329.1 D-alanine--D-alanine ligase [Schumannella luteola]
MIRVALLFGGRSSEHGISCATAAGVLSAIDRSRFEVVPIGITRDGAWTLQPDDPELFALRAELPEVADNGTRVRLPEVASSRALTLVSADGAESSLGDVDVFFPILHGRFGEDGTVQGQFELLELPYVGNGLLASALAMDKHMTKTVLEGAGIDVAPWVLLTSGRWEAQRELFERRIRALSLPVFVKPSRAGSSVGVTKVSDWVDLDAAVELAFAEDRTVLVEAAIVGREVECAVLEGRDGGATRVSVAGEIVVTGREFYDFEAKYLDPDAAQLICPAALQEGELHEMQRIAAQAFEAIGGAGLARVDFFFDGARFVVNEINTMPGFTPISMFPSCWQASGMSYPELITELIELGLAARR